jgi:hypothetical protein
METYKCAKTGKTVKAENIKEARKILGSEAYKLTKGDKKLAKAGKSW